ncbi:hypothetical protein FBZ89_10943 [Nitrospirillum amazonense]|uniref:Uncharacterized protein n=1 Tax=Nitrospirillum amazonense TaxID=28077 RepID=A0A560FAL6_9PROT|nr:hypothetical protein [Nitrospirillum amazonense]TWB18664.1 hypothetical protein FBZ89_10943 [Nitrospirillum amazonense]
MSVLHVHFGPTRHRRSHLRQPACTWLMIGSALAFAATLAVWFMDMVTVFPIGLLVGTGVLCLAACVERVAYKPLMTGLPGPGWQDTGERFTDPGTGAPVAVYYNAARLERRYVRLDRAP